jgi:hypothetical protein
LKCDRKSAYFIALSSIVAACSKSSKSDAPTMSTTPSSVASESAAPFVDAAIDDISMKSGSPPDPVVREEAKVTVDGVVESWRLEWRHPPLPECMGDDWYTCPCAGFELGETGDMDLVRERPGAPEERLALGALFEGRDVKISRYAPTDAERQKLVVPSQPALQKRALRPVMIFGDYDHDGRASEFVLQIAAIPCGHTTSVVVGIDKNKPKLHIFSSVEAPKDWLTLESRADWEKVRAEPPVTLTEWTCGDHGADAEESVQISADARGLHTARRKKDCALQSPP